MDFYQTSLSQLHDDLVNKKISATELTKESTTVTRTVTLDTTAPVIQSVTLAPNPVDAGNTYIITVAVGE